MENKKKIIKKFIPSLFLKIKFISYQLRQRDKLIEEFMLNKTDSWMLKVLLSGKKIFKIYPKNMTKILIVGGTGFVGYHLAKKTLKKGWQVYSISTRRPPKIRQLAKVKYIICDITNKKKLKKKLNFHFDYVVNLGGYVNHSDYSKTIKSHYHGCKNLVDLFINKPPNTFVQVGSSNEYGRARSPQNEQIKCKPVSTYGKAKLLSTKYLIKMFKKKIFHL